MLYVILGYLLVSALVAALLWLVLIAAKRSDERMTSDFAEDELNEN